MKIKHTAINRMSIELNVDHWAIQYLVDRYSEQELYNSGITLKEYLRVNKPYVLMNIQNGTCKRWNKEVLGGGL